jgi:cytochrome c oxidase subunit IV
LLPCSRSVEKILFVVAVIASLYFTYKGVMRIVGHIASGQGKMNWSLIWKRIGELIIKVGLFQPVFRFRLWTQHPACVHWLGLPLFLLVNLSI